MQREKVLKTELVSKGAADMRNIFQYYECFLLIFAVWWNAAFHISSKHSCYDFKRFLMERFYSKSYYSYINLGNQSQELTLACKKGDSMSGD